MKEGGGGFQTVVLAESAESAWEVAMDSDSWETLPFDIPGIECFPRAPMISSSEVS